MKNREFKRNFSSLAPGKGFEPLNVFFSVLNIFMLFLSGISRMSLTDGCLLLSVFSTSNAKILFNSLNTACLLFPISRFLFKVEISLRHTIFCVNLFRY